MRARTIFNVTAVCALATACGLGFSDASFAQGTSPNSVVDKEAQQNQDQQLKQRTLQNGDQQQPPAPKVDPAEEAAYKAFFDAGASAPDALVTGLVDAIRLLGPITLNEKRTTNETVQFSLPRQVR